MEIRRDVFQAIADPTRRAILGLVALQAMTPGAIAENFNSTRQTISKHIQILYECELLNQTQTGREIYYHFNPIKMKEVSDWVSQYQKFWDNKFDSLESYTYLKFRKRRNRKMEKYNTFKQEENILIHTRILDAPRDLVWEVWTTPEHIKEWWGPNGFSLTTKSMNVEPGKIWDFIMHGMGRDWDNKIEYVEVKKPSFLSYKHSGERSEDYNFTVTILFEEVEGKTLLTMKSVFKSKAIIEELNRKVNAIEGGKQTLNRLENYIKILESSKP